MNLPLGLSALEHASSARAADARPPRDFAGALTAGGIAALSPEQVAAMESPPMELGALGGGGLFKTVQAPYTPGSQTWAVLLVHPRGVISATKRVRVVSDRAQLTP